MKQTERHSIFLDFLISDKLRVCHHLILILIVEILAFQNTYGGFESKGLMYANITNVAILLTAIYINLYILIPRQLIENRLILYLLSLFALVFMALFILAAIQGIIFQYYGIGREDISENAPYSLASIINAITSFGFIIAGSSTFALFQRWTIHNQRRNKLERETIQLELKQLKNQINPHFLLNMLNNANELTIENPEEASQVLSKLNDMLRYQFNDSAKERMSLSADIHFLTDFLNLEKIRRDNFEVVISKEGDINSVSIPPLLFIPFVENAVKHNPDNENSSYVHLYFKVQGLQLIFVCENSKPEIPLGKSEAGGLGLANIRRRLDLLYDMNYTLEINNNNTTYKVILKLTI
uniref:sensor histidine kinase n=1 Tax=uncultured Bacteroides sp. TaxID=162156 RepID=UPI0025DFF88D|nr:histidine kinase [uncultured Bacteroides sp.]